MGTKNNPLPNLQKDAVEVWHQQNLLMEKKPKAALLIAICCVPLATYVSILKANPQPGTPYQA